MHNAAVWLLLLLVWSQPFVSKAADWPQWLGPHRDGKYDEPGVITTIPAQGLPIAWRVPVKHGYAGPAVADGKVYLFEYEITDGTLMYAASRPDILEGKERLRCLDASTGKKLWAYEYDCPYAVSYGGGPRCTPTVDGDRVYILGAEGDLHCLATQDGSVQWSKNFQQHFGAKTPIWGHSAHPLIDGDTLYCVVGGEGCLVVAFDKTTGVEKWRKLDPSADGQGYCPPVMIKHNGSQQLLIWSPDHLYALKPASGELIWKLPMQPSYGMAIARPQQQGDKLYASAMVGVSVLMKLNAAGSDVEVVWAGGPKSSLQAANVTPLFTEHAIYGCDCQTSALVALDPNSGERLWATTKPSVGEGVRRARHGSSFLIRYQETDNYFLFSELGDFITARLTPDGYTETGRMHVLEPTSSTFGRDVVWSCPAFANRSVYLRNDKELVCLRLEPSTENDQ